MNRLENNTVCVRELRKEKDHLIQYIPTALEILPATWEMCGFHVHLRQPQGKQPHLLVLLSSYLFVPTAHHIFAVQVEAQT